MAGGGWRRADGSSRWEGPAKNDGGATRGLRAAQLPRLPPPQIPAQLAHCRGTSGGGNLVPPPLPGGSLLRIKKAPCVFKEAPVGSAGGRKVKMISWC